MAKRLHILLVPALLTALVFVGCNNSQKTNPAPENTKKLSGSTSNIVPTSFSSTKPWGELSSAEQQKIRRDELDFDKIDPKLSELLSYVNKGRYDEKFHQTVAAPLADVAQRAPFWDADSASVHWRTRQPASRVRNVQKQSTEYLKKLAAMLDDKHIAPTSTGSTKSWGDLSSDEQRKIRRDEEDFDKISPKLNQLIDYVDSGSHDEKYYQSVAAPLAAVAQRAPFWDADSATVHWRKKQSSGEVRDVQRRSNEYLKKLSQMLDGAMAARTSEEGPKPTDSEERKYRQDESDYIELSQKIAALLTYVDGGVYHEQYHNSVVIPHAKIAERAFKWDREGIKYWEKARGVTKGQVQELQEQAVTFLNKLKRMDPGK